MRTSDFDYILPPDRIAQIPVDPRDSAKLMIVNREKQTIEHGHFYDIIDYLQPDDLLVWNNSKVFKARLFGEVELDEKVIHLTHPSTDKMFPPRKVEIFLVRPMENVYVWKALAKPGKKLRLGMKVVFAKDFEAEVIGKELDGTMLLQFAEDDLAVRAKANKYGEVPLPPYIDAHGGMVQGEGLKEDRYQTVYAKHEGSVAAPTAGFHFTPELIAKLESKGVKCAEVTLHVGLGTFLPVKADNIEEHKMHSEWVEITDKNASLINEAKGQGRRVVAVGTTTARTLEGVAQKSSSDQVESFCGDINIFITPGFKFQVVDALITNFHLPKSTLLMLVSAFIGDREFTLDCYKTAVEEQYRFYSFGDAIFIE